MQEEVTSKTIALAIKTAKLDGKVLQAALRQFMQLYRKKRDTPHRGKQMLPNSGYRKTICARQS